MLFMAISLSKYILFLIFSNEANNTFASFWSGAEEEYLPDLLLTISSCSDDTNPFLTTDKELVKTFLSPQQSANLLLKYTFTFLWKFSYTWKAVSK